MEEVAVTPGTFEERYAVRKMELRDLAEVLEIQRGSPEAAQWNREDYEHACVGDLNAWVAESRAGTRARECAAVCGFLVSRTVPGETEILNLAVSQDHRRRRVASELLAAALEQGRAAGAKWAFAEARESNAAAIDFYRCHGFKLTARRHAYYVQPVEDALVFSCQRSEIHFSWRR